MSLKNIYFIFLLVTVICSPAMAEISLMVWQRDESSQRIVLPRKANETPAQAFERYYYYLGLDSELGPQVSEREKLLPFGLLTDLSMLSNSNKLKTALIANMLIDLYPNTKRIKRNVERFGLAGGEVFVIAPAADIGLTKQEAAEFRILIAEQFSLLVSLGGYDLHSKITSFNTSPISEMSRESSLAIDQSEIALVSTYKDFAHGVFMGICRGHEVGALVDGHDLISDISERAVGATSEHMIPTGQSAVDMITWHPVDVKQSLLARLFKGLQFPRVLSAHHMSVDVKPDKESFEVASYKGVNEALQSNNGLSLSLQFHIEMPVEISQDEKYSRNGFLFLKRMISYARLVRQMNSQKMGEANSCRVLFMR